MHIERLTLTNFRCFGGSPTSIDLSDTLVAFVGSNATGKTAAFAALSRLFGVARYDQQVTPEDFHVPAHETEVPGTRALSIEVVVAFPELQTELAGEDPEPYAVGEGTDDLTSVPEFFRHMAATDSGDLKCRFRLDATWTDDGSIDGTVTESFVAIHTFDKEYDEDDCTHVRPMDRSRIQVVYVPASRDGARHLTTFLKSRLWRAGQWSDQLRSAVDTAAGKIGKRFRSEPVVAAIEGAVDHRWKQLYQDRLNMSPAFHLLERDLAQLVNKSELRFVPGDAGRDQRAEQLSDGQRSLLEIALTAATIDLETTIASGGFGDEFDADAVHLPSLTVLVVEEPENSLAPHYLSRIISQMLDVGRRSRAQALVSSQSASVLGRVDPHHVRHFRLDQQSHTAVVNLLALPENPGEAATYVREAVQAFPELYFARFVVLGEGSSEQVVIPRLAHAAGTVIDQSFVAVVPLGGRHVGHMWRLLKSLEIPHVTLLDLDEGRAGGGVGRLQTTCRELQRVGVDPFDDLDAYDDADDLTGLDVNDLDDVITALRNCGVVFCTPLDLDMSMLRAFPDAYMRVEDSQRGPSGADAFEAVLGANGERRPYDGWDAEMQWYRYLFLGRSKPTTHVLALGRVANIQLSAKMPDELRSVVSLISAAVAF